MMDMNVNVVSKCQLFLVRKLFGHISIAVTFVSDNGQENGNGLFQTFEF